MEPTKSERRPRHICNEIIKTETTFRSSIGKWIPLAIKVADSNDNISPLLKSISTLSEESHGFSSTDVIDSMFEQGQTDEAITLLCKEMEELLDNKQNSFMDAVLYSQNVASPFIFKHLPELSAEEDKTAFENTSAASILPMQRILRYELLFNDLMQTAQQENLDDETLNRLENTLIKIASVANQIDSNLEINRRRGLQSFFGTENNDLIELFMNLAISIPKNIENNTKLAKELATLIKKGKPTTSISQLLEKHHFVNSLEKGTATADKIKRVFYLSRLSLSEASKKELQELPESKARIRAGREDTRSTLTLISEFNKSVAKGDTAKMILHLTELGVDATKAKEISNRDRAQQKTAPKISDEEKLEKKILTIKTQLQEFRIKRSEQQLSDRLHSKAATTIQKTVRGYQTKTKFQALKAEQLTQLLEATLAKIEKIKANIEKLKV